MAVKYNTSHWRAHREAPLISVRGSDHTLSDLNPILDEASPTSTGCLDTAFAIAEVLGIKFNLDPPRAQYKQGWGLEILNPAPILCSWTLIVQDMQQKPTMPNFDLTNDGAPSIIGLDVKRFSLREFLSPLPTISLLIPGDDSLRKMSIFITDPEPLEARARLDLIGLK